MQVQSIGADQHLVVAQGLGMRGVRGTAYQGVDLDLAAGQAHAICAENKGGKTELLLTLAGRPTVRQPRSTSRAGVSPTAPTRSSTTSSAATSISSVSPWAWLATR